MLSREYLSIIKVEDLNPHITWQEWAGTPHSDPSNALWKPERFLQYEILGAGPRWCHDDRLRQNIRAERAQLLLDRCHFISFHRIYTCTVIEILCFPSVSGVPVYHDEDNEIIEDYQFEEAFTDMLLWHNDEFSHVYYVICQDQPARNVRWLRLWAERFMPNPYAMWPTSLISGLQTNGYPEPVTIKDLQQYAPWDYWTTE